MQEQLVSRLERGYDLDAASPAQGRLTDRRWNQVAAALPMGLHSQTRRGLPTRRFIEAVLWAAVMDATWPQLPSFYGNYQAVSQRFDRWVRLSIWTVVIMQLGDDDRVGNLEKLIASRREVLARRTARGPRDFSAGT